MKYKNLLSLSIVMFSALVLSACLPTLQSQPEVAPTQDVQVQEEAEMGQTEVLEENSDAMAENTTIVLSAQEDGQTAFELLQENHEVVAKEYDFGVFIESVDGLAGSNEYYWALYVNEEYAQQGADQTVLSAGDTIEFRYEEVTY